MAKEAENSGEKGEGRRMTLNAQQVAQMYEGERSKFDMLNNQRITLINRILETDIAVAAIKSAESSGESEKAMIFVGAGAYLEACLADSKHVMMNLPGGVVVRKTTKEALEELQKRRAVLDTDLKGVAAVQEKTANSMNTWAKIITEGRRLSAERSARQK